MKKKIIDPKRKSLIESGFNIILGFSINLMANVIIFPLFGMNASLKTFGIIGVIFTCISLIRTYCIRRLFAKGIYETLFAKKEVKNDKRKK